LQGPSRGVKIHIHLLTQNVEQPLLRLDQ
jgi:hypothetical protein